MKMKYKSEILSLISSSLFLLTSFVLVGGAIYILGHMHKEPFNVDFSMDNNTANAIHDMMNLANMTRKECPYCPCKVYKYNENSELKKLNFTN
jgi:hypothetical protein